MDNYIMSNTGSASSSNGPFKLDEGFAEDSLQYSDQVEKSFFEWINAQSEPAKAEIAYEILRTLRTSNVAAVVDKLMPLLHMDPLEKLPPEVTAQVFSYLDASTLLTASLSSHTWRERILDPRLWHDLYQAEGWGVNMQAVRQFEQEHSSLLKSDSQRTSSDRRSSVKAGKAPSHGIKRRATADWLQSSPRRVTAAADTASWREQHGHIEADADVAMSTHNMDEDMLDEPISSQHSPSRKRPSHDSADEMDYRPSYDRPAISPSQSSFTSRMLIHDEDGDAHLNWPYFYQQRYKLEQNWMHGKFTNFQLPHPAYPGEAHTECVYTIQFSGKWLVSGSRDRTLRVWDLDTRRLRSKPLTGHSQSVLCLQFDPSPEEDVIISGSSDSSIIIWRFSDGEKLHTIDKAHDESVLNLRFNHQYLITCSKDKKLKVWNRHSLLPTDAAYPRNVEKASARMSQYVIDLTSVDINLLETRIANGTIKALKPYTHLLTLEGHTAAVNAIQIHGDIVVSASGDRNIRMWNIRSGKCFKVVPGHQKGIACVQYDSRRIVSGSSDNTVRIYDPYSAAELAVLYGHKNLVRTVQAGFGDAAYDGSEDLAAARAAEAQHIHDVASGLIVEDREYLRKLHNGELGSNRVAFGARLPPGGGGTKWARIVSGSYDESIIIWKKDPQGHWIAGQTLRQEAAVQASIENDAIAAAAQGQRLPGQPFANGQAPAPVAQNTVASRQRTARQVPPLATDNGGVLTASQIVQQAMNASMTGLQTGIQNVMGLTRSINTPINLNITVPARTSSTISVNSAGNVLGPAIQNAMNQATAQAQAATQAALTQAIASSSAAPITPITNARLPVLPTPAAPQAQPQAQPPAAGANAAHPHHHHHHHHHHHAHNHAHLHNHAQGNASRVFKLQFDSRRIVCCSQDSRIIGWDFANGDEEIAACVPFFLGP